MLRKAVAEGLGTFCIVFFGCGAMMLAERFPGIISPAAIPVIFGLAVTIMVYALGHISGAHFNPAVTAAFIVARHFPAREALSYWIAQIAGAFLAMLALTLLLPKGNLFGEVMPLVSSFKALAWEFILTFFLMFVIISVATDTRSVGIMAGAAIGATVMLGAFVGGPVTGAAMNPARAIAPAVFSGKLISLWIYIVGPIAGAIGAALLYEWMRCESSIAQKRNNVKGCC